jgi:hypothetical protein
MFSVLDAGNLSSLNGYPFGVLGGQSTVNNLTVNNNLNTAGQTATQRGFSMTFSVGAGFYLSKLTVKAGHVSGTGGQAGLCLNLELPPRADFRFRRHCHR